MRCDFCGSPEVEWEYPAHDIPTFTVATAERGEVELSSAGAWPACNDCHMLIVLEWWDGLAERAVKNASPPMRDFPEPTLRSLYRTIHDKFRLARYGKPIRIKDSPR